LVWIDPVSTEKVGRVASDNGRGREDDFASTLRRALREVDSLQKEAESAALRLAAGQGEDLHDVMLKVQQAELALLLTVQVRNKIIEAYQEIMRMQI